ncbi:hypothetical protein [Paenibacillus agricola]|uniref:Glycoside hydrolase family 57 N-terminal domain-containing protein n=1 Tax=Paenibacillus agricola TaxID=2716264 RepID=A0ABX0J4F3_9BACL|nr:hypothetical protein [Paenibacillus agricola]NHN28991.1 hypothetical protein [Paenibacillus agricola]
MSTIRVPIAIVHHGNQYLITNGYLNRPGIAETIGLTDGSSGLRAVLDLHCRYDIPFHLHISGTFIEACAWYDPIFLEEISDLWKAGLVELIGSTYSQNIMTLSDREFNRWQLEEELRLYQTWLGVDPSTVKGFWIPERVWDTDHLAATVTDTSLCNGGFRYILADDRLLLQGAERSRFDQRRSFDSHLYKPCSVQGTTGLIALPLSTEMRLNVPFHAVANEAKLDTIIDSLLQATASGQTTVAIYGDDMEKAAGIPPMWSSNSIEQYQRFLQWIKGRQDVEPVLLGDWLKNSLSMPVRTVGPGTYLELAGRFGAGEDYSGWAGSAAWAPYKKMLQQACDTVSHAHQHGTASNMLELAKKHVMASAYETGWHDPVTSWADATPAPWARALASHARAAYVLLEAARWEQDTEQPDVLQMRVEDIDGDGYEEVILRNHVFAVVITPRHGGRILYAFFFRAKQGRLFIGNPSDDWNLLEELNCFMDNPMNHPGALADYGFEHDLYEIETAHSAEGSLLELVLVNRQEDSAAYGLRKQFTLKKGESRIKIRYTQVPPAILPLSTDIGLSPDYLRLLREGQKSITSYQDGGKRGFRSCSLLAWVYPETADVRWRIPRAPVFGHGFCISLSIAAVDGSFYLGADATDE